MKFADKTDFIILSAVIFVCIILWGSYRLVYRQVPASAEIYYDSQLVQTVDLTKGKDKYFSIPRNEHVVFHLYPDGSISFAESDCRDQICVRSGKLDTPGEVAACLPNKIIIKIVAKDKSGTGDPDIVIGSR